MRKWALIGCLALLTACAHDLTRIEAGPPGVPRPPQVTAAEITAGTETQLRSYSVADVVSLIDTHSTSGVEAGAFDFTTWNGNTNAGTKDAIRDQLFVYDTDGDGDIDNIDGAVGGGDITGVGPGGTAAGDALTDGYVTSGTTLFIWEGTTDDTNEITIAMPSADPAADVTLTFPDQTGTMIVGPGAGMSDNVIPKVDGATSHLLQASGITIDDSNNLASVGTISSGAITSTGTSTFGDAASPDAADGATLGSATAEWSDLFLADGGVINLGADQDVTLTHVADTGILLNAAMQLQLRDSAIHIDSADDGHLDLTADVSIDLNGAVAMSSTAAITGAATLTGGIASIGAASDLSGAAVTLGTVAGTITDGTASWNTSTQALAGFSTITGTGAVTGATVTDGTVTLAGDGTITGLAEGGLPNSTIVTADVKDNDLTTSDLSATLTFADGDIVDLSGVTHTAATDEGLVIPTWANVVPTSDKKFLAADGSSLKLYNGGWVTIGATAAPTDAQYLTLALDATLSAERVLTAGYALDFTDAGANGNLTVAVDTTEISADGTDTFSDGSQASVAWTVDTNDTADNVITFTNGLTTFNDAVTVTDTLTATNGIALGTSKSIVGTTAVTLGDNTQTWAVNSSDWDIDATGIMTGIGNITSDGVITATGFTIGAAAITEAELEILDGATLTTTQINYLNAATGTTGTTNTNVVFSAAPTFTGTMVAADIDGSGTFSANLFTPDAADGADIGSATLEFSDIYLADGSIIYLGADQDVTLTHVADTGIDLNTSFGIADDKFVTFGGSLAASDWTLGYDETTSDALEFHTAGVGAALATTPMFLIQTDSGALGMTADQDIFSIYKGTTELFTIDEDGDVYLLGTITSEPTTDPGVVFDEVTASDTDYWLADNADQEGDNDDLLSIGTGTTIGSNTIWTINPSGDMNVTGGTTTDTLTLYGGTYSTTFSPGTPTESATYQWPLADGTNGQALVTNGSGTLDFADITATPAGASGDVQYNNTTMGAEAAFNYNATNNTLSITQAASNPTLQVGDGTYSWQNTPQVGIEGVLEVDGIAHTDGGVQNDGLLDQNEDIDIDFDANDEELSLDSTAVDYAAGGGIVTIHGNHAGNTNDAPLLRLVYQADGDAQDTFILCEDNSTGVAGNGDDMFKVASGGVVTAAGLGTFTGGLTIGTGTNLTVGATQWNSGDSIDGEQVANDTIDDDSLDFADITLDDFVTAGGDSIVTATDNVFDFTRSDAGVVTITASDNDAIAALTVLPGGAAALTLGGASTTAVTVTTDSTGDAEVVLPNDSIGPDEMAIGAYDLGTSLEADTLTEGGIAVHNNDEMDASSELAAIIDDETGSGLIVFATSPTFTTSILAASNAAIGSTSAEFGNIYIGDGNIVYMGADQDVLITHVADTGINLTTTAATSGVFNLGNDDDVNDDSVDLILHDSGVITLYDADDDTSVTLSVGDGTTTLSVGGGITATGTVEGATLTEGGNAVYNSTETPGGELGGTWASPTVDDTGITLTSITIGALLGVDSIDATGAVDMDIGSGDITDVTIITDGGSTIIDGATITAAAADNPYIVLDDDDDMDIYIINDDVGAELEFSTDSTVSQNNLATLSEAGTFTTTAGVTVGTLLSTSPQSLSVTTEADITLTGSMLLLTGDDDEDNDTIDLQNGTTAGQRLVIIGVAGIDGTDTITVAMTDTTCTGCTTVTFDEIGDSFGCDWTGSTWNCYQLNEVP